MDRKIVKWIAIITVLVFIITTFSFVGTCCSGEQGAVVCRQVQKGVGKWAPLKKAFISPHPPIVVLR